VRNDPETEGSAAEPAPKSPPEEPGETLRERRERAKSRHQRYKSGQYVKKVLSAAAGGAAVAGALFSSVAEPPDGEYRPGKDRWGIKTSIEFDDSAAPTQIPIEIFATLPPIFGIVRKDFEEKRLDREISISLSPGGDTVSLREGDFVSTVGYIHYAHRDKNDSDYHIQLNQYPNNDKDSMSPCLIVEIPHPDAASEKGVAESYRDARKFIRDRCFGGTEPRGKVEPPLRVEVAGQLFYDLHHSPKDQSGDPGGGRGKTIDKDLPRMKATTIWEIHPVTELRPASP
jgi:hypothetical protein